MSESDSLIGTVIAGRYQVIRLIGRGGMGAIYEVRHLKLGRNFALKRITGELNPEALRRFHREADLIASFRHPHIIEIIDRDTLPDGSPYMVMELLQGEDLAHRISRGPLLWHQIAKIGDQILSALSVAHRAGVIHRDLKPANIFVTRDDGGGERAKLLDFGISKIALPQALVTTDSVLLGTPAYMSPEQASGKLDAIKPSTDVWAMGAIFYEMVMGVRAVSVPAVAGIIYQICHGTMPAVTRADAPPAFVRLIARALSRGEDRITDIEVMRRELRTALRDVLEVGSTLPATPISVQVPVASISVPLPDAPAMTTSIVRDNRPRVVVAVAVLALAGVLAFAWLGRSPQPLPAAIAAVASPEPIPDLLSPIMPAVEAKPEVKAPKKKKRVRVAPVATPTTTMEDLDP